MVLATYFPFYMSRPVSQTSLHLHRRVLLRLQMKRRELKVMICEMKSDSAHHALTVLCTHRNSVFPKRGGAAVVKKHKACLIVKEWKRENRRNSH